ncbi:RagB/SusD family nutrient uptake outer membrane protein [Sabulibacter ruber]|uniref:RagB/SusD family nutrient uptake outer membrane protein n=1 Tax=Sabulibacter ruber TaxID=2811901 RepID=UPI001A95887F|nr:RagB/SusD family nutrient uptake outer membrane protein [Sabulibacter ruber]
MRYINKVFAAGLLAFAMGSCTGDLDREPFYDATTETVYRDFNNYKGVLARVYAGYAVTGQSTVDRPDIGGFDVGESAYLRAYWQLQELTTDEAVISWSNAGLPDLHEMDWASTNNYTRLMYDRLFFQIAVANEFIRETSDEKLSSRGITGANLQQAQLFRAEARFLRALTYWHALDLYGNVPFVTEESGVGSYFPEQISRADLFNYVESELLAVEPLLVNARQNEYGRADKAAAWTLLTKLYLNAEVYTGTPKYTEAITYAKKVIDAGYALEPEYEHLFLADNHSSGEIIFPIVFDGTRIQSWGGMSFIMLSSIGGTMNSADFGFKVSGWGGLRATKNLVELFPDLTGNTDERAMFHTSDQNLEINTISSFQDGYPITKFKNVTKSGQPGSDPSGTFADTDFPMFRLADVYLMYAEAVLRGGSGGDMATALQYVNQLRQRAFNGTTGNIGAAQLNLDFILNERGRELNWEAHRRTDLIRYGRFTSGTYVWPWKGGVPQGTGVESFRALFPIPASDLISNPNLKQNTGY